MLKRQRILKAGGPSTSHTSYFSARPGVEASVGARTDSGHSYVSLIVSVNHGWTTNCDMK